MRAVGSVRKDAARQLRGNDATVSSATAFGVFLPDGWTETSNPIYRRSLSCDGGRVDFWLG